MPDRLGISITWRCNLACSHCLQDGHGGDQDMPVELFTRIVDEATALGVRVVSLTGGEATLHPAFTELVDVLRVRHVPWTLTTNGLALRRMLQAFQRYPPIQVTVSLEGPDADAHDRVRGPGTFERSTRAIRLMVYAGLAVQVQATLTRPVLPRLAELHALARTLGASRLVLAWPVPTPELVARGEFPSHAELLAVKRWVEGAADGDGPAASLALHADLVVDAGEDPARCRFLTGGELFVDSSGWLCTCCQMAGVGEDRSERLVDLSHEPLGPAIAFPPATRTPDPTATRPYRCLGCLAGAGKLRDMPPSLPGWPRPPAPTEAR